MALKWITGAPPEKRTKNVDVDIQSLDARPGKWAILAEFPNRIWTAYQRAFHYRRRFPGYEFAARVAVDKSGSVLYGRKIKKR